MIQRALITCLSDPSRGPRPNRMIRLCLNKGYKVEVLSPRPQNPINRVQYYTTGFSIWGIRNKFSEIIGKFVATVLQGFMFKPTTRDKALAFGHGFLNHSKKLGSQDYKLIIVEDIDMLPFAFSIRGNAKIAFDAREYYPRQRESSLLFRLFQAPYRTRLCYGFLPLCDEVITVSPGLAKEYKRVFNIQTTIIRSVPSFTKSKKRNVDPGRIRLVHHGLASANRQLEKMLEIFEKLDGRFSFDLYLTGHVSVINRLKRKSRNNSAIQILDPVPMEEIIPTLTNYDIGIFYVEPVTFNLKYCLPNKLFEFIQARLAVAIGPSPDMATVIKQYRCGFVADEFTVESMASLLNALTVQEIESARECSDAAAHDLCFENEQGKLDHIFN